MFAIDVSHRTKAEANEGEVCCFSHNVSASMVEWFMWPTNAVGQSFVNRERFPFNLRKVGVFIQLH